MSRSPSGPSDFNAEKWSERCAEAWQTCFAKSCHHLNRIVSLAGQMLSSSSVSSASPPSVKEDLHCPLAGAGVDSGVATSKKLITRNRMYFIDGKLGNLGIEQYPSNLDKAGVNTKSGLFKEMLISRDNPKFSLLRVWPHPF
jgi:hypothetical protein